MKIRAIVITCDNRAFIATSIIAPVLEPHSVDLICTDPQYTNEQVQVYRDLARFAATVLKPGKLLAAHADLYHLPEIMRLLSLHLQYVWTIAVTYPQCGTQVIQRRIRRGWKPILLFSAEDYRPEQSNPHLLDRIDSGAKSKQHYCWEQPVAESEYLVKALTHEGGLVVDPFPGSGTTGVACKQLNRRFIGCDVDRTAVQITTARWRESGEIG